MSDSKAYVFDPLHDFNSLSSYYRTDGEGIGTVFQSPGSEEECPKSSVPYHTHQESLWDRCELEFPMPVTVTNLKDEVFKKLANSDESNRSQ